MQIRSKLHLFFKLGFALAFLKITHNRGVSMKHAYEYLRLLLWNPL